jgi:hypothetical protein
MKITLDANILVRANTRAHGPARELLGIIRSQAGHTLQAELDLLRAKRRFS